MVRYGLQEDSETVAKLFTDIKGIGSILVLKKKWLEIAEKNEKKSLQK
jgi:hypothetical protein